MAWSLVADGCLDFKSTFAIIFQPSEQVGILVQRPNDSKLLFQYYCHYCWELVIIQGAHDLWLKAQIKFFLSLNVCVMVTRSCPHNINSPVYYYRMEASRPGFKSSCPILLFQHEMVHTGYWLRNLFAMFFHPWPQLRSAGIRPWVLASKLALEYDSSYSKRYGVCLILRNFFVGNVMLGPGLRVPISDLILESPNGWLVLLEISLGVRCLISTLLSLS